MASPKQPPVGAPFFRVADDGHRRRGKEIANQVPQGDPESLDDFDKEEGLSKLHPGSECPTLMILLHRMSLCIMVRHFESKSLMKGRGSLPR